MSKPKPVESKPKFVTKPIGGDKNGKERTVRVKKLVSRFFIVANVSGFHQECYKSNGWMHGDHVVTVL